jgi:hypothetical protein
MAAVDTAPASFPEAFRCYLSIVPKAWIGRAAVYAGGGPALELTRIGDRWLLEPELHVSFGVQFWVAPPLALYAQLQNVEPIPVRGVFDPQVALGAAISFSLPPRPAKGSDLEQLWILLGFAVATVLFYVSRI